MLQLQWTRLKTPLNIWLLPKMGKVMKILGATRNVFFSNLTKDGWHTKKIWV